MAASEQNVVTEAPNVADNGGEVPMNVDSFSENSPHFTVDNMSIQVRVRTEKTESFAKKIEDAIHEAFSMSETRKNLVIEASGCDDTDIEALNGVLRKLGIKGRRTVEYSAGVYRIVMSAELHEVVLGLCENVTAVARYTGYYKNKRSTTQLLNLQYQERPAEKDPDTAFAPICERLLHKVRRQVLDYLPEKPLPSTVFEVAYTESTVQVDNDVERWHCSSYFVTEETLSIYFRPTDLSLVFTRRDLTVENIERVLNGLEGDEYDTHRLPVTRWLIDRLDVKIQEKRALIVVFEHWDDHDEIIRLLRQDFGVMWNIDRQNQLKYKKKDHKLILKDLRKNLQRLNEMRARLPRDLAKASLEDYRLCYRVVDNKTREEHFVDCDEYGTVADRSAQKLKLHIRPLVGFALKNGDDFHFTNTQLANLWEEAIGAYKESAQRRTDVRLEDLTEDELRWQCKLLGLRTADLDSQQMIQDILLVSRRGLIILSNTHIPHNV
ncbi:hypothetical protein TRICI_004264 [Trichomonascus ciferrii]|uniref:Uncharacterized protein n=1 Tax=Trichomonascus ciferrii TaxID=44093 RepID=A0A642V131_9ASCO|nr:hypothetical protein TRICI_004264 [Trichomonascus ciferrii]